MAWGTRLLLRIPGIRERLLRLASAETTLKRHEVQIGSITAALAEHQTRLSALTLEIRSIAAELQATRNDAGRHATTAPDLSADLETRLMEALDLQGALTSSAHAQIEATLQQLQMQIDELRRNPSARKTG